MVLLTIQEKKKVNIKLLKKDVLKIMNIMMLLDIKNIKLFTAILISIYLQRYISINEIFGYGGFCHVKEEGLDIKYWVNNDDFIRCIRLFKTNKYICCLFIGYCCILCLLCHYVKKLY